MDRGKHKAERRARRRGNIRRRLAGTPEQPRLSVYKSLKHIYAQVIDDLSGRTLAAASTAESALASEGKTGNAKAAEKVGAALAERAKQAGVSKVCFDRGGFKFHGRLKSLADAARKGGLEF